VVPSLPGYGFSSKPKQPGMTPRRIAALWVKLMGQLGYNSFATQGGDWGATVSTWLGLDFPDRVSAIHLNYIPGSYRPFLAANAQLSEAEKQFQQDRDNWFQEEGGYGHIQSTKPNTVGFGLNDSPAGLAAWIVEKVRSWSDCDGDVEKRFSKDEILTNIQIYWVTGTIYSSMRLYQEAKKMPVHFGSDQKVRVRCAVARFPKEAPMPPRDWVERGYNVERWTEMKVGAHFAAWEEPALLAGDLIEFLA
ncbi:MAG TPA: alpha/beta hydrolase, partial [Acidobacteriota bacterium]|nr:alpha/beta hydrolase [Acidobacteriota bacterium]